MAEMLSQLSDALAETVGVAGRSVVRVEGRSRLAASGFVWSAEGVIVTASHVLERDDDIKVDSLVKPVLRKFQRFSTSERYRMLC